MRPYDVPSNDQSMIFRMNEYHALLISEFKLPVKHLLIFLGSEQLLMKDKLSEELVFFSYETIDLKRLDSNIFLSSQIPEVFMLSLLGAYEKEHLERILRKIVQRIESSEDPPSEKKRYLNQLLILSRLRKLEVQTQKLIDTMPIVYTRPKEDDGLYQWGKEEGKIEGREEGRKIGNEEGMALQLKVFKMLKESTPQQVSDILNVELEFVMKVKQEFDL